MWESGETDLPPPEISDSEAGVGHEFRPAPLGSSADY
jgi:hypothetical protein